MRHEDKSRTLTESKERNQLKGIRSMVLEEEEGNEGIKQPCVRRHRRTFTDVPSIK